MIVVLGLMLVVAGIARLPFAVDDLPAASTTSRVILLFLLASGSPVGDRGAGEVIAAPYPRWRG
jgi:hypothetical protein